MDYSNISNSKNNRDLIVLEELRKQFILKIDNEWQDKWLAHGRCFNGFDKLTSLNAFLEDLLYDIESTIKPKLGLKVTANILISKDSLRRFIQKTQLGALKTKTRHTISHYIGYDGWEDFLNKCEISIDREVSTFNDKEGLNCYPNDESNNILGNDESNDIVGNDISNNDLEITTKQKKELLTKNEENSPDTTPFLSTNRKNILFALLTAAVLLLVIGAYSFHQNNIQISFDLKPQDEKNFPTVVKLSYDIGNLNLKNTYIKQHTEPLDWYLKKEAHSYRMGDSSGERKKGEVIVYCDKPGLHHLELVSDENIIRKLNVPIRAKDWFGIAYAQRKTDKKDFICSNKADWEELVSKQTKKKGKRKLSIPPNFLDPNLVDSRYRVDFFYSGNINIDVDEMAMEVEFYSDKEAESFDCKYLQMGFVDSKGEYTFIYSPISTCSTEGQVKVGAWHDSIPFPNELNNILNMDTQKQNHTAKIYFKDKKIYVELDGFLRYEKQYNIDMGNLEVFNISLNGESSIKHFKVSNTTTLQTIYDESFD